MDLCNITNKAKRSNKKHVLWFDLEPRFAPLIKRGMQLEEQLPQRENSQKRAKGATNVDLWVDGYIYLIDPPKNSPPPLCSLKGLVEAMGEMGSMAILIVLECTILVHK